MEGEEDETEEIWFNSIRRDDFDESCFDEIVFTRSDGRIKACMDGRSGPDTVLNINQKVKEILHMKEKLSEATSKEEGHRTQEDLFALIFQSEDAIWKILLKQRMKDGLKDNGIEENNVQDWEYYAFLMCLWSVHYFDKS